MSPSLIRSRTVTVALLLKQTAFACGEEPLGFQRFLNFFPFFPEKEW